MDDRLGGAINDMISGWLCCASTWVKGEPVMELSALGHEDFSYSIAKEQEQAPAMHFDDIRLARDAQSLKTTADKKRIQAQEDMFTRMQEHEEMCQRIRAQERLRFLQMENEKVTPRSGSTSAGDSWPDREQTNGVELPDGAAVVEDWQRSLAEAIAFADKGSLADAIALADQRGQILSARLRHPDSAAVMEGAAVVEDWQRNLAEAVAFAEQGSPDEAAVSILEEAAATASLPASMHDAHGRFRDEQLGSEERCLRVSPEFLRREATSPQRALPSRGLSFGDDVQLPVETPVVRPPPLAGAFAGATTKVARMPDAEVYRPRAASSSGPTDYSTLPPGHVLRGVLPAHLLARPAASEHAGI